MAFMRAMIPSIMGAGTFIAFYLGLDKGFPLSLLITGISAGATFLITRSFASPPKEEIVYGTDEYYLVTVNEGHETFMKIRGEIAKFKDIKLQEIGKQIEENLETIFTELKKNPSNVMLVRELFTSYLDLALKNIEKYNELSIHNLKEEMRSKTYDQAVEMLALLNRYFESCLHNDLLKDDYLQLDIKTKTLKKLLQMEGIE